MNDVFISYASANRATALMVAKLLRDRGIPIWIDQYKISGGDNWSAVIIGALKSCSAVLVIISRDVGRADGVEKELSFAAKKGKKLFPLYIEENVELPDSLAWWLTERQRINGFGDPNIWLPALLSALPQPSELQAPVGPGASNSLGPRLQLPYFADRDAQEKCIYQELYAHYGATPDRPIFFILAGDQSQCVNGFVDRLRLDTLPRYLKQLKLCDQLEWKNISWPRPLGPMDSTPTERRSSEYMLDLRKSLELPPTASPSGITTRIDNFRMSMLFTSTIDTNLWQLEEPELIKRVASAWSDFPNFAQHGAVIGFLSIILRQPKETFFSRLLAIRPTASLVSSVAAALKNIKLNLSVILLPELADVSQVDVREWVLQYLRPNDVEDTMRRVEEAYKQQRIRGNEAVPMNKMLPILKALASGTAVVAEG